MARAESLDQTVERIFERLERDERVHDSSIVVIDARRGTNGVGDAAFVLIVGLGDDRANPVYLTLLRTSYYVELERSQGHALFMRADHAPRAYATIAGAVESIHGYLDPGQEQFLFEKAKSLADDAVILEIGSYHGRSTTALAFGCVGSARKVYCVDLWGSPDLRRHSGFFNQFRNNLSSRRLWPYIVPLHGSSAQVLGR